MAPRKKEGAEGPLGGGGACSERDGEVAPLAQGCGWKSIWAEQGICVI